MSENNYTDNLGLVASRWQRLWASLLDCLIMMTITLPVTYFTGGFTGVLQGVQPTIAYQLFMNALGLVVFIIFNGQLLIKSGRTIGKKVLGIKIVDLNGDLPTKKHLLKRYAIYFVPAYIPVAGPYLSLLNMLFIFGKEKRCIHDYVAGTKVIKG